MHPNDRMRSVCADRNALDFPIRADSYVLVDLWMSQQVRSSVPRSKVLRHGRTFWLRFLALLFGHVQRDPDMLPPLSRFAGLRVRSATLGTRWLDLKFLAYPAPG